MTAQVNDLFRYQGKTYSVTGFSAGEPFDPHALDLNPQGIDTACWRGYQISYGLDGARLLVIELGVNLVIDTKDYHRVEGPIIDGVRPIEKTNEHPWFNNNYLHLHYPLSYNGGLLLGDDFMEEFYEHMGFQDAWKYRELLELKFTDGWLTEMIDHSPTVAEIQAIASIQQQELNEMYAQLREAKQSGQEDLFEQIRDQIKARRANPPQGKDYDEQIREQVRKAFDRSYHVN
jgi:hypothetical protein